MQAALPADVFNIEVDCHHVYEVGDVGVLVHNAYLRGGSYAQVRFANRWRGGEVHHMPAASVSPYTHRSSPAIWMTKADHRKTASWGSSKDAIDYRKNQERLIARGQFMKAVQNDIADIRQKFPDGRYEQSIQQMLQYIREAI